jgi:PQQ-like domain
MISRTGGLVAIVVALLLAGCQPRVDPDPEPAPGVTRHSPMWNVRLPGDGTIRHLMQSEVVDDAIVLVGDLSWGDTVAVVDKETRAPRWIVPRQLEDTIVSVRVARESVVVVRRSNTVEVHDLKTGAIRMTRRDVSTLGITWTTLLVASAMCDPDCLVHAIDLRTGHELWKGPRLWRGKVMAEPGEPSVDEDLGTPRRVAALRAPEPKVLALPLIDGGVMAVDAVTGKQISKLDGLHVPDGMAFGTDRTLLRWTKRPSGCAVTVTATDLRTSATVWQLQVGTFDARKPEHCLREWQPEAAPGLLAFVTPDKRPSVVDIDTGRVIWTGDVGTQWIAMNSSAVMVRGVAGRDVLGAIDSHTGALMWTAELPKDFAGVTKTITRLLLSGDSVAYATPLVRTRSHEDLTWMRDLASGRTRWVAAPTAPLGFDGNDRLVTGWYDEVSLYTVGTG